MRKSWKKIIEKEGRKKNDKKYRDRLKTNPPQEKHPRSDSLSSKQEKNLDCSKTFQITPSLVSEAKPTGSIANNRFKSPESSEGSRFLHNNSAGFVDLNNPLSVSKEADIESLFSDENIAFFLEDQARELLIATSTITNEGSGTVNLNSSPDSIKVNNDYETLLGNLLDEDRKCRRKAVVLKSREKTQMDPARKAKIAANAKARYEKRKQMLEENPDKAKQIKQSQYEARKRYLAKLKSDPTAKEIFEVKAREYQRRYKRRKKNDSDTNT